VLAILAMLAHKSALCVAAGGCAPLIPAVARRASAMPGRDGKAGATVEQESDGIVPMPLAQADPVGWRLTS